MEVKVIIDAEFVEELYLRSFGNVIEIIIQRGFFLLFFRVYLKFPKKLEN